MEALDPELTVGIYDGDTSDYQRKKMRANPPHRPFTTP